ncbi:hypothetical protein E4U57_004020 [Claviceps arundinis]|uniref:Uncharacterized protein n=1 Tax=Claviceps arundinis TaxID=1623583 RepID=A0ABQ7PNH7_9HYPO|nr:hypothetical protein E4U57_004020 [Claviceps arundinis]
MTTSCHHESSSFPTTPVLLTRTVSSTTTVILAVTVTETTYQTANITIPACASQTNTVRLAARQPSINSDCHDAHEHSSLPFNPAISVIKQKPKGIDLTTTTKYSKHHSRHKIHLNQISTTLTIEAACLHIIGNEPRLSTLPTPSTMRESLKYPVVTISKVVTAYIVSLVVVTISAEGPRVMSASV